MSFSGMQIVQGGRRSVANIKTIIAGSGAEVKAANESNPGTNSFTDEYKELLDQGAENRNYVAQQAAFVASIYSLIGIGIDSDGNLFAEINSASNVSDMVLNPNGELLVTYS